MSRKKADHLCGRRLRRLRAVQPNGQGHYTVLLGAMQPDGLPLDLSYPETKTNKKHSSIEVGTALVRKDEPDILGVELEESVHVSGLVMPERIADHELHYVPVHRSLRDRGQPSRLWPETKFNRSGGGGSCLNALANGVPPLRGRPLLRQASRCLETPLLGRK